MADSRIEGTPTGYIELDPAETPPTSVVGANTLVAVCERHHPIAMMLTRNQVTAAQLFDSLNGPVQGIAVLERSDSGYTVPDANTPAADLSIVIPTVGADLPGLERALTSIASQREWIREVIVVANRCDPKTVEPVVSQVLAPAFGDNARVVASEPGLSRARNVGMRNSVGEWTAFLDDDIELADDFGINVAAAASAQPDANFITGLLLGDAPSTDAELWFEAAGGFRKGLNAKLWTSQDSDPVLSLVDVAKMGTGALLIARTAPFSEIGGFCETLGIGSPSVFGGEDLEALYYTVTHGGSVYYTPSIIVRHPAHADWSGLENQAYRYGAGITNLVTYLVVDGDLTVRQIIKATPQAFKKVAGRSGYAGEESVKFPLKMKALELLGMARGPFAYFKIPRALRRSARRPALPAAPQRD